MNKIVRCGEVDVVTLWAGRTFIVSFSVALFTGIGLWCRDDKTFKKLEKEETRLIPLINEKIKDMDKKYDVRYKEVLNLKLKKYKRLNEMSLKENIINFLSLGMKSFEADGN